MPELYIPISEDEQKFSALVERVFADPKFANSMRDTPAHALEQAGYKLTANQKKTLESQPHRFQATAVPEGALAFPLTRPIVNVITRGTRPVVSVVTKGTQPVVSVAVNTILAVSESKAPALAVVAERKSKSEGQAAE